VRTISHDCNKMIRRLTTRPSAQLTCQQPMFWANT
jgi:hypothetical protein